jgi:hypothetical protein
MGETSFSRVPFRNRHSAEIDWLFAEKGAIITGNSARPWGALGFLSGSLQQVRWFLRLTVRKLLAASVLLALSAGSGLARPAHKKSGTSRHHAASRHHRARKASWKRKGQQRIDPDRAREIQEALIREKYLTGEASGVWDARTEAAMTRYQADNGWQTKITPDSRALIKLGLGPDYSKEQLLNAPGKSDAVAAEGTSSRSAANTADVDKP